MHASYIRRVRGRGDRARTCNIRFWRPVLFQLSYAPMGYELVVGAKKKPTVSAFGLTVGSSCLRDYLPHMRPTCLPPKATKFCSVHWRFAGFDAASSTLCPAYTGSVISIEVKDRMRFVFRSCAVFPGGRQPYRIYHRVGHVQLEALVGRVAGAIRPFTKTYARRRPKPVPRRVVVRSLPCGRLLLVTLRRPLQTPTAVATPVPRAPIRCQTSARCPPPMRVGFGFEGT